MRHVLLYTEVLLALLSPLAHAQERIEKSRPAITSNSYESPFLPSHQRYLKSESATEKVELEKTEPCMASDCHSINRFIFLVENKTSGLQKTISLNRLIAQVDEIYVLDNGKFIVIGRPQWDISVVLLYQESTGKLSDFFYCFHPTISPNGRFIAYEKFFPVHFTQGVSAEYLVYDLKWTAKRNRPFSSVDDHYDVGTAMYPSGSQNRQADNYGLGNHQTHSSASGFFWSPNGQWLIFADRIRGNIALVAVDFSKGILHRRLFTQALPVSMIVNTAVCKQHPEDTFRVSKVSFLASDLHLKIGFQETSPGCLAKDQATVSVAN